MSRCCSTAPPRNTARTRSRGVIYIVLKRSRDSGTASAYGGIISRGDGAQAALALNFGVPLGPDGLVSLNFEYRHRDHEVRRGYDINSLALTYGPVRNKVFSSPRADLLTFGFDIKKPLDENVEL